MLPEVIQPCYLDFTQVISFESIYYCTTEGKQVKYRWEIKVTKLNSIIALLGSIFLTICWVPARFLDAFSTTYHLSVLSALKDCEENAMLF